MLTSHGRALGWHRQCAAAMAVLAGVLGGCPPVCNDCLSSDGDHVEFTDDQVTAEHPGLVLLSAWRDGRCQSHVMCTGAPDVYMGDVRWGPDDFAVLDWSVFCKKEELVTFAKGTAPHVEVMPPEDLQVNSASAVAVPVSVWVAPALSLANAKDEVLGARDIYETLGTGIDLQLKQIAFYAPPLPTLGVNCFFDATAFAQSTTYDAQSLNVYFVESVGYNHAGQNCYDPDPTKSHQEIMFVSGGQSYSAVQTAHEIGHALGLVRSLPEVSTGDLFDEVVLDPYLTTSNLMYSGGDEGTSLTIGQIYRMHFDKLSWLNRAGSSTLTALQALAPQYPLECQNDPATGDPCPPLALHPAGGWP